MTCGESRFVFTVINALCNSLKPIKEAEVFFLPPPPLVFNILKFKIFCFPVLLWLHENGSVSHTRCTCTIVYRYSLLPWTVVGISG